MIEHQVKLYTKEKKVICFVGIDPSQINGKTAGAIATILVIDGVIKEVNTIELNNTAQDIFNGFNTLLKYYIDMYADKPEDGFAISCYIEKVWGMPNQGVAGINAFMEGFGILKGFLISMGIAFEEIIPKTWQKHYLPTGTVKDIEKSTAQNKALHKKKLLEVAQNIFPVLTDKGKKVNLKNCDSLLIAYYLCKEYLAKK